MITKLIYAIFLLMVFILLPFHVSAEDKAKTSEENIRQT